MLEIQDLHVYYGGVHALRGITLSVPAGSIVSLLGANGAGKTTTLRTICGLVQPKSGTIRLEGEEIQGKNPQEIVRRGISMVPEGRRVFTNLSVRENLLMGAWIRSDKESARSDLEGIFHLFPVLKERLNQRAGTLSGGEQQMLAIGRALMSHPKLLLMDEPSLGLAPVLVSQLFATICDIHALQGMTILLVEQNARAAFKIAEQGYVLETGRIALSGVTEELSKNEHIQKAYIGA